MRYGSVCSGIEAATMAWHPLGWEPAFFSEIEKFPSAVLAHHYPHVPNHGDMTNYEGWPDDAIDLLAGGTPCQSFSVAGLRKGLDDPRGDLMLTYLAIARRYKPRWLVWENVPGVLSSGGGRDFGTFLRALGECGYGFAYRVLDAQHTRTRRLPFAVPQRRRRVWVVGYLGDWRRAAAVLFDAQSLRGDTPPRREAGKAAPTIPSRSTGGGGLGTDFDCDGGLIPAVSGCLSSRDYKQPRAEDNVGIIPCAIQERAVSENPDAGPGGVGVRQDGASYTLEARRVSQAVAFTASEQANSYAWERDHAPCLTGQPPSETSNIQTGVRIGMAVRRLTPRECERLMGFPDDFTRIPYRNKPADQCPDGPRYKALGNSWAVNCAEWIGERIALVEAAE